MSGYDALIIGGGPAGCSAAITLAQNGWRVGLIEAKHYPHHKVCGEFLSPECGILLERLGLTSAIHAHCPISIDTVCITAPDGTCWEAHLPAPALGISRYAFDAVMAERARAVGVDICEGTTTSAITGTLQEGFVITARTRENDCTFNARTVIAAHGKRSNLDRALDRPFLNISQPYVGLKAHFSGPPLPGRIELHTFRGGYCGMSEIEGGITNVCLLAQKSVLRAGDGPMELNGFIESIQHQNPYLRKWLSQAKSVGDRWLSIGEVPFVQKTPLVGDVLMVGDAAGLVAPLAGDGIAMALHSGQMAASSVHRWLLGIDNARTFRQQYAASWRRAFQARLRLSWLLQPLMFDPRVASLALRVIRGLPPLGNLLISKTRDMGLIAS